jgi:hypothetical protein
MRASNAELVDRLCTNGVPDARKVAEQPWETQFQPLPWTVAREVYMRLQAKGVFPPTTDGSVDSDLLRHVLHLCDRGYLGFREVHYGAPSQIYPYSLIQLVVAEPSRLAQIMATWDIDVVNWLDGHAKDVVEGVTNSSSVLGRMPSCSDKQQQTIVEPLRLSCLA